MTAMGKKLGKFRSNISLRYLGLTSTILVLIELIFSGVQISWLYNRQVNNLKQQVKNESIFLSSVSQEAVRTLDIITLEKLMRQTSIHNDLVYSIIVKPDGQLLSGFLNQNNPIMAQAMEGQGLDKKNILKLIERFKNQPLVYEIRTPIINADRYLGELLIGYSLEGVKREFLITAAPPLLASVLVSVLLVLVTIILFNREIRSPLQEVAQHTQNLAGITVEPQPKISQEDEVAQIKAAVDSMAEQLQNLKALQAHIVEQEKTEKQLQDLSRAKSEFLATISHEIRTPLNAVNGMTGLLLDTPLASQQKEFVNIIRSSGEVLLTMINNILDFSKIEAQRLDLEEQPFELRECIEEALRLFIAQGSEKKLELAYLIEPQTPSAIIGDVTRLRQILVNLLSNAVKFTETGEVVIYVKATPISSLESSANGKGQLYEIQFAVKDTGIGIPSDRIDSLFESFSQVDASTTRKYGGTGLGLAISKHLSEMMGGKMWVHSQTGKGSTFYFTVVTQEAPSSSPANSQGAEQHLVGKRVLIVDDNVTNQKIFTLQAQSWGMFTCAVESSVKALEWLQRGVTFDIAILDMHIPNIDGLTLAREIRKQPAYKDLPMVMLSSLGKQEVSEQAADVNFAAILSKPIQQSQLYNVLIQIFAGKPVKVSNSNLSSSKTENLSKALPLRILLAEDVVVNQKVALLLLEQLGYRADLVSNGLEVLGALRRQRYDVVLMDMQMPEMDGLTATRRICEEWSVNCRPRIIAMTANAMQEDRQRCLEAGMDDYIPKPIRLEELRKALSQCQPASGQPSIDPKVLAALRKMAGNRAPEVIRELIESYLEDSPAYLQAITTAVNQDEPQALKQAAHSLRSCSVHLGATQLSNLCKEVETIGRNGTILGASEKVPEIELEYERVCLILHKELTTLLQE